MHTRSLAVAFLNSLALALAVVAGTAVASESQRNFNIEAQPAATALNEFARQADITLVFSYDLVAGASTRMLKGSYSLAEGLDRMLEGTRLAYQQLGEKTIAISDRGTGKTTGNFTDGAALRMAQVDEGTVASDSSQEARPKAETGEETKLEEIVVTAQKRKESLQEVPISISVVSGADLDKSSVQGITETLSRIPAVAVTEGIQGGGTQITMRGVSNGAALLSGASTSAYYIDSIPFGFVRNAVNPDPSAYDLDRVEVLRGPQGTLYGANALNGVVRILTHDADLDTFEFKARTSASTTNNGGDSYRGDAAINIPLVDDKLAVRAVLGYNNLSGWVDQADADDANDAQLANARIKLKARPTENLTIGLSAWRSQNDYGGPPMSDDNGMVADRTMGLIETDFTTYGLDVGYDFGAFSISSASSYIDYSNGGDLFGRLITELDSRVFSQEVLLSSTDAGAWDWSLGAFYRDAEDGWYQDLYADFGSPAGVPDANWIDTSEQFALFGEVSRRFFHDQLKWTLGLRTFRDENSTEGFVLDPGNVYTATYEATTPRAVLTWTPSTDLSIYGSYSQGFRSGSLQYEFVTQNFPFYPPVEPDTLTNYEMGAKGSALDGRISFEAAVFYIDWRDVQQVLNVPVFNPATGQTGGINVSINGSSASGFGADLALTVRPAAGLELGTSLSWNDLTMDKAVFSLNNDNIPVQLFAPGERLGFSPEYTASLFADYAFPIGASLEGRFSGSVNHLSSQDSFGGTTRFFGDDITIARASFSLEGKHWTTMLYGDNLNNEYDTVVPQFGVPDWNVRPRPRTIGLQLEYQYGR